jgi:hypothetical protein
MVGSISRRSTSPYGDKATPGGNISAGLKVAIERGWLKMHESGTSVTFTPAGAELFA